MLIRGCSRIPAPAPHLGVSRIAMVSFQPTTRLRDDTRARMYLWTPLHARRSAFTIVELVVVLAIIAVLASLLLPALSYGRFRARVTTCSNNYRQWGVAVAVYATDDGKGRLPSFPLPVHEMLQYSTLEPWFVSFATITNMGMHGVTVPMWFCPLRGKSLEVHRKNFQGIKGRDLLTPDDLVEAYESIQGAAFAFPDLLWWVPRRLGESSLEFPDPKLMKTRVPDRWPSRTDDPTVSTMPIASDWTVGRIEGSGFAVTAGGHRWAGSLKNNSAAYADGHVAVTSAKQLRWQAESPRGLVYFY